MQVLRRGPAPVARSSPASRSRTRSPASAPRAARPTASCTCSRSPARPASSSTSTTSSAISKQTPLLADLKPGGRFVATDLYRAGGVPLIAQPPRRGRAAAPRRDHRHRPHDRRGGRRRPARPRARRSSGRSPDPLKKEGGLAILRGNLAPEGAVVKLAGTERRGQTGPARVFECEEDCFRAVKAQEIEAGRRDRDPQRGPGRRPRHARDAPGHRGARRRGHGREGRPAHRRPLLGRDPRPDDRPRRAGGRQAAARSPPSATATSSRSTSTTASSRSTSPTRRSPSASPPTRSPEPIYKTGRHGQVRGHRLLGLAGAITV